MTGLVSRRTSRTLPLRSSTISADIKGFTARTTATLTYYNDNRSEIEGVFVLPLDHATTIVEFEAIIEGHYMFADVRDAMEMSKKKVLFETESMHDGLFRVSVGRISPWVIAEIQVTIIGEITALFLGDALRYALPQAFSPKVVSSKDEEHNIVAADNANISTSTLSYSFNIEIEIEAPCLLYGVQSNTHPIQVDSPPLAKTGAKLVVTIPEDFEPHDEVFELLMFLCRPREPYIVIEEAKQTDANADDKDVDVTEKNPINSIMNNPILMLSYSPDISTFKHDLYDSTSQSGEYFLLIDSNLCETSAGDDIKVACLLFLKCLPCNCYFNVLSYGANFQSVFMTSQAYSCNTLESAIQFVLSIHANFNRHSRLQPPLQWAFDQEQLAHTPKQLFIITSSVSNVDLPSSTLQQVRNKHHFVARCYVFDFTSNPCTHVLERLTVASRGRYCMVNEKNSLRKQMLSCLKVAMEPVITDVNICWILPEAYDVIYTPENLPSVFFGERLNLYAILATKETALNIEKHSDSVTSIKEFWFEESEMFEDYDDEQDFLGNADEDEEDDEDQISDYGGIDMKQQVVRRTQSLNIETAMRGGRSNDNDNEVFLTEEEARRLSGDINHPKRLSMDRVQKWRVSRFPQNCDIDTEYSRSDDIYQHGSLRDSKEKIACCQNTHSQLNLRKKTSSDGAESVGSTNSYSSNFSFGSHCAFPGFPTRMSSCRSIEARSPHFPKHVDEMFSFHDTSKEKHLSVDRGSRNSLSEYEAFHSEMRKKQRCTHNDATRQRLTEALVAEHANTHLVDRSNECTIERLLESAVIEKRNKLQEWLKVQEEMTQCLWPITDNEKKDLQEQHEWRDSGIGNRSSSEARTSDLEEEVSLRKKRFTRSCAQFENHSTSADRETDEIIDIIWPAAVAQTASKKGDFAQQEHKRKPNNNNTSLPKKKFKAKSMWNAIVDKVRSIGTIVTERSGENKFNRKSGHGREATTAQTQTKQWENISAERQPIKRQSRIITNNNSLTKDDVGEESIEKTRPQEHSDKNKTKSKAIKNPPIIESSRTIGTSFMLEIGKSEIGDVPNLHLLPSQALIYLSGQCGRQIFKRIIPFQLEINNTETCDVTNNNDITIHQLAAKSIIHDLEMQMENSNDMLENSEKLYIKNLIGEVSKAANVLSKYTTFVTVGDKCEPDEILSTLEYEQQRGTTVKSPFKFSNDFSTTRIKANQTRSQEEIYQQKPHRKPLYEIVKEPLIVSSGVAASNIRKTRLHLNTPNLIEYPKDPPQAPNTAHRAFEHTAEISLSPYEKLLRLMTAEGYWKPNQQLATIFSVPLSKLRESCPLVHHVSEEPTFFARHQQDLFDQMWVTTLVLAWLNKKTVNADEEQNLIKTKAKKWLSKQTLPEGTSLDELFLFSEQALNIVLLKKGNKKVISRTQSLPQKLR